MEKELKLEKICKEALEKRDRRKGIDPIEGGYRITKQIRVSIKTHRKLKLKAIKRNSTISKLADYIINKYINGYLKNNKDENRKN